MKTFAATFALMSLTGAIGLSEDGNAGIDLAGVGDILRVT